MMRARLTLLAASMASLLAGCSLAPTYHPPAFKAPVAYKEVGQWQPAVPADASSRGDWWTHYHDATLDQLIGELDSANPSLAAALSHYDQARAVEAQARSFLFPTINATGFDTANKAFYNKPQIWNPSNNLTDPQSYRQEFGGLNLNYEVDLWGQVRNTVAAEKAGAEASAAELESVRLSLRAQLADNYIALRGLDEKTALLNDVVLAYQKALSLTEHRFHGGIDSALSVSRAQAQLDSVKAELVDVVANRALFEHAIASLVGQPASVFSIAPARLAMKLPVTPVGLPGDLLQRRPDIAAAERQVAAANAQVGVARAAYFPTVSLGGLLGVEAINSSQYALAPTQIWSIGPAALMTLFDGGYRKAINRQAKDALDIATDNYRSTVLNGFQQVEDSLSLLNNLALESSHINAAIIDTNLTLTIAMNRYREGMVNYLEVVTAQTAALRVSLQGLDLKTRRLQANVDLVRALGGGYNSPQTAKATPAVVSHS
jgi:NodT family efflux transporter outer membrane factor (OMF) lipoprotein